MFYKNKILIILTIINEGTYQLTISHKLYTLSSEKTRQGPTKISSVHPHATPCHSGKGLDDRVIDRDA